MLRLKRAYEPPAPDDGLRVLVDRRWPCNVYKAKAHIDRWMKEIAPSEALTAWFGRDPAKWTIYRHRYWKELDAKPELVDDLLGLAREGVVTLVYRAKDTAHNNALALKEYLERRMSARDQAA